MPINNLASVVYFVELMFPTMVKTREDNPSVQDNVVFCFVTDDVTSAQIQRGRK